VLGGFPACAAAARRLGECLADHAGVNVAAVGDLPDGHAAGGVVADGAEQPGFAGCLGFRR